MKLSYSPSPLLFSLGLSLLLIGIAILSGHMGGLNKVIMFFFMANSESVERIAQIVAMVFTVLGAMSFMAIRVESMRRWLGLAIVTFSLLPLLTLFSSIHWIDSLGGFPAIGSGQGIIKYAALLALGLTLVPHFLCANQLRWVNYIPVALVLLWIGGMKFTLLEAKGVEDLVATSPFMSWMYTVMDVQQASNLIGVYDLIALVILGVGLVYRPLLLPGVLMSGAVFVMTQTFLVSFPGSIDGSSLTNTGIFIIKDLWFIANLWVIYTLEDDDIDCER